MPGLLGHFDGHRYSILFDTTSPAGTNLNDAKPSDLIVVAKDAGVDERQRWRSEHGTLQDQTLGLLLDHLARVRSSGSEAFASRVAGSTTGAASDTAARMAGFRV